MILGLTSPSGNSVSWFLCATCPSSKSISIYRHAALELQVDASVRSLDISTPVSGSAAQGNLPRPASGRLVSAAGLFSPVSSGRLSPLDPFLVYRWHRTTRQVSRVCQSSWELRAASIWCPLIAVVSFPHAIESTLTMIMLMKDGNASSLHTPATSPTRRRLPQQRQLDRIATPNIETDIRCFSHPSFKVLTCQAHTKTSKGPGPLRLS